MSKLYFIAEIGQNHQGDLSIAKQMVDSLVGTGVKAIKTAKRDIELHRAEWEKQPYLNKNSFGNNYYEHRKALEFSDDEFIELKNYVESKGFDFISSFTDIKSFDFLNSIGLKKIKIASQRTVDLKLLNHVAENFDGTIFMSSGMSDFIHVHQMIGIFRNHKKYLMQCTSIYPCPESKLNLRVLKHYRKIFKKYVDGFGFSGHHMSIAPDIAALTLGANIIERHYTLDRTWKGTDQICSLELDEIKNLISDLKIVLKALGTSEKFILEDEKPAAKKLRGDL